MKKTLFSLMLFAGATSILVGCKKEEAIAPLEPGTAIVKGKLTAKLDETSLTPVAVPAGTGVTFIINGYDLDHNPDPGFDYKNTIVKATVDANGNYSASLPARQESIWAEVKYDEFEYDATVLVTDDEGFQVVSTVRKTFTAASHFIEIVEGAVKINDRQYNILGAENSSDAIIKGRLTATFVDNVGSVDWVSLEDGGTTYTVGNDIPVTGGTGTGMTIDIWNVDAVTGAITGWNIAEEGDGYTIGDIVTVTTGGGDAQFEITDVNTEPVAVPAGVVISFVTNDGNGVMYKVATDANGEYVVKVPVTNGVDEDIEVRFADFEYQSTYWDWDANDYVTGLKIYGEGNDDFTVDADEIREENYEMYRKN
jgi:hypothetical protein